MTGADLPLQAVEFAEHRVEYAALGEGPAVVLLHGGNCSADDSADIARASLNATVSSSRTGWCTPWTPG